MPTTIARPEPMPATEYTYRDRMLMVTRGSPLPLGATPTPSGVNFVLHLPARHRGLRWSSPSRATPRSTPRSRSTRCYNRTGDHWHVRVDGLPEEFCYGYRVDGPEGDGHRYDPSIVLLDPALAGALVRPALGDQRRTCPAAA